MIAEPIERGRAHRSRGPTLALCRAGDGGQISVCGNVTGVDLDRDLIAYYDAEAHSGSRVGRGPLRAALRESFAELLAQESRRALLDVGAGPGVDTIEWQADGFAPVGIDLAHANVGLMHERGLTAVAGSIYELPFADRTFDPDAGHGWQYQFAVLRA